MDLKFTIGLIIKILYKNNVNRRPMMSDNDYCLILCPKRNLKASGSELDIDSIVEYGIKPVLEEDHKLNFKIQTPAEIWQNKIPEFMIQLKKSKLVIIIYSGFDPDIIYMTGISHGITLKTIVVSNELETVPSLLKNYNKVFFKAEINANNLREFQQSLNRSILNKLRTDWHQDSPIEYYLEKAADIQKKYEESIIEIDRVNKELKKVKSELENVKVERDSLEQFLKIESFNKNVDSTLQTRKKQIAFRKINAT